MNLADFLYRSQVVAGAVSGLEGLLPSPRPLLASFYVNSHCNKREFFGRDLWPREAETLTVERVRSLMAECRELGITSFRFPVHPGQISDVLAAVEGNCGTERIVLVCTVRGLLPRLDEINRSGVTHIVAGLPVPEAGEAFGEGYDFWFGALASCTKSVKIATYLTRGSAPHIEDLIRQAQARGFQIDLHVADRRKHLLDLPPGEQAWFRALLPSDDEVDSAYAAMRRCGALPGRTGKSAATYLKTATADFAHCVQPFFEVDVWTDGSVRLCHSFEPVGHVGTSSLKAILQTPAHRDQVQRAFALNCPTCAAACQVSSLVGKPWRLSPSYLSRRFR